MDGIDAVFEDLDDPRTGNAKRHLLHEVLVIALCTVLCGGENCADMALFGRSKRAFLQEFLRLEHGIPSHDTFSRVFRLLDPAAFHGWFLGFMRPVEFAGWYEGMRSGGHRTRSTKRQTRIPACAEMAGMNYCTSLGVLAIHAENFVLPVFSQGVRLVRADRWAGRSDRARRRRIPASNADAFTQL
jgi:hypothetical protein